MPLFEIKISTIAIVFADDKEAAMQIAKDERVDICREADLDIEFTREIFGLNELEHGWDGQCIPYGDWDSRIMDLLPENAGEKFLKERVPSNALGADLT